jgi:regulator of sigma E protease
MIGETVQYGILNVLNLVALIAMNLGVMNLLPIPALDGGRILFVLVEAVIGKPIPPEKEGIVHLVGFGLLMLLTVFVFINDIIRVVT